MTLAAEMPKFFAAEGPLASLLPSYTPRSAQIEMAEMVAEALERPGARLVVEAGTGTGKSLAYLVPALLSDQQVCIATGTKALQDQLYGKDLPLVLQAIHAFSGQKKVAALMKGRQNYLCLTRWEQFARAPTFTFPDEVRHLEGLRVFAAETQTGDRADVEGLPEPFGTWNDLDASSETCVGQSCPAYQDCWVTRMRREAEKADVIVANHHLLCADLRVRLEALPQAGKTASLHAAQVIPDVQALILDEAHALPDVATEYFGVHFASGRADRLASDVERRTENAGPEIQAALGNALGRYETAFGKFLERIGPPVGTDRIALKESLADEVTAALREQMQSALADLCVRLETIAETHQDQSAEQNELIGLSRRAEQIAVELGFLLDRGLTDPTFVTWLEGRRRGFSLSSAPIDVASALDATLFASARPVILTSATLAVSGDPAPFVRRVGLDGIPTSLPDTSLPDTSLPDTSLPDTSLPDTSLSNQTSDEGEGDDQLDDGGGQANLSDNDNDDDEQRAVTADFLLTTKVLPSPFDFARRAALYAPADMPGPNDEGFFDRFCDEVRYLAELSQGGALILFTSFRMLEKTADEIAPDLIAAGLIVLRQGDAPKVKLLKAMLDHAENEEGAVLFATQSFWEGVDLPGAALRLVIIDRLPFKPPTDPVQQARYQLVESQGLSSFNTLSVPEAALALKQGVGRLIRTEQDAGVVAVLDGRLRSKGYGKVFLRTLPPMVRIGSQKVVKQFWDRVVLPALSMVMFILLASVFGCQSDLPPRALSRSVHAQDAQDAQEKHEKVDSQNADSPREGRKPDHLGLIKDVRRRSTERGSHAKGGTADAGDPLQETQAQIDQLQVNQAQVDQAQIVFNQLLIKPRVAMSSSALLAMVEKATEADVETVKKGPRGITLVVFKAIHPARGEAEHVVLQAKLRATDAFAYVQGNRFYQARDQRVDGGLSSK